MSRKKKKYIVLGEGEKCSSCGEIMERRKHTETPKTEQFFSEWDICKNFECEKSVQTYGKYLVHNEPEKEVINDNPTLF